MTLALRHADPVAENLQKHDDLRFPGAVVDIFLDAHGQVCIVSPDALRFLGSALTIRENRVRATDRTAERLLQNAIRLALTPPHEVSTVALPRAEGRALIAKLAPAIIPGADQSQAGARLTLIDLDDRPEPCERVMRDLFGLTGAEARLAKHMARGDTLEDYARATRISLATVRTQLKFLFNKTNTHRQGEARFLAGAACTFPASGDMLKISFFIPHMRVVGLPARRQIACR
jgi:DNA-binding CsgD family transcriptional regulator